MVLDPRAIENVDPGSRLAAKVGELARRLSNVENQLGPLKIPTYTSGTRPPASSFPNTVIFLADPGSPTVLQYSTGTDWVTAGNTTGTSGGSTFSNPLPQAFTVQAGSAVGDLPVQVKDTLGDILMAVRKGAAEGAQYGSIVLPMGDIINLRNVQGGMVTGDLSDLNLDLGAGASSPGMRGNVAFNFDVGRGLLIYDGSEGLLAAINATADGTNGSGLCDWTIPVRVLRNTAAGVSFSVNVSTEAFPRLAINGDGSISFGPGSAAMDVTLARRTVNGKPQVYLWSSSGEVILGTMP